MKGLFWAALASGPLVLGLWLWAGSAPGVVESVYSRTLYPLVAAPWSRLVGLVPWALAPWLIVALVAGAVALFFLFPPLRAVGWVAAGASVLVAWFVLGWGLNYQRLSWAQNHGMSVSGGTVADLEGLARSLARRAGELRPRDQEPTAWATPELSRAVTAAYQRWGATEPLLAGNWASPKAFPVPEVLSYLGIAGIFIPHTGEPLVNTGPNNWQLPFTAAHEAAHLRGWAREDEANFLAFLVLQDDPDPKLAYSAWSSALLYVASALGGAGPEGAAAWSRVASETEPGVLADWRASFAYWDRFKGPVMEASHAVNDAYLKTQGQSDGVKSYGRMVDLLLAWRDH